MYTCSQGSCTLHLALHHPLLRVVPHYLRNAESTPQQQAMPQINMIEGKTDWEDE